MGFCRVWLLSDGAFVGGEGGFVFRILSSGGFDGDPCVLGYEPLDVDF